MERVGESLNRAVFILLDQYSLIIFRENMEKIENSNYLKKIEPTLAITTFGLVANRYGSPKGSKTRSITKVHR